MSMVICCSCRCCICRFCCCCCCCCCRSPYNESSGVRDSEYASEFIRQSSSNSSSWLDRHITNPRLRGCIDGVKMGMKMVGYVLELSLFYLCCGFLLCFCLFISIPLHFFMCSSICCCLYLRLCLFFCSSTPRSWSPSLRLSLALSLSLFLCLSRCLPLSVCLSFCLLLSFFVSVSLFLSLSPCLSVFMSLSLYLSLFLYPPLFVLACLCSCILLLLLNYYYYC